MRAADSEMTLANRMIYGDEVALVNVFRRLKWGLPTGYGDIYIKIEVFGNFGKFIRTTVNERAVVDRRAPGFIGEIVNVTQSEEEEVQAGGPQARSGS